PIPSTELNRVPPPTPPTAPAIRLPILPRSASLTALPPAAPPARPPTSCAIIASMVPSPTRIAERRHAFGPQPIPSFCRVVTAALVRVRTSSDGPCQISPAGTSLVYCQPRGDKHV